MLEKVLENKKLGNAFQINYILKILSLGDVSVDDLKKACASSEPTFTYSYKGVMCLLEWLGVIEIADVVVLKKPIDEDNLPTEICTLVFKQMAQEHELHHFLNNKNLECKSSIFVNNYKIDFYYSPIRNVLMGIGLFVNDNVVFNHLVVRALYQEWFLETVVPLIEKSEENLQSLDDFKKHQKHLENLGAEAELFVLHYEKKIRASHPKVGNIKIISEDEMGNGFDIKSYLSDESIILDKFIEVKSYSGTPGFFWSKNEVSVAQKEKEKYFLYLVNRESMSEPNYHPIMIRNPFEEVFSKDVWKKECNEWRFSEKELDDS